MTARISPARLAAFRSLLEMESRPEAQAGDLLRSPEVSALPPKDRNLTTALVMGVLRWRLVLRERMDALVTGRSGGAAGSLKKAGPASSPSASRPKMEAPVRIALELGAVQLLLLSRIPPHAAIFESVELAKFAGHPRAAGLVNAVLRKLAATPRLDPASFPANTPRELAAQSSHPAWLVERWASAFGLAAARNICSYDQEPPPATIRLIGEGALEAVHAEGVETAPASFVAAARRILKGDVTATQAYRRGLIRIQDEGSQLIAEAAGSGLTSRSGPDEVSSILDCCAAPGGKTAILAERYPGARIEACEVSPARLAAMRERLAAPGIVYHRVDAQRLTFNRRFDLVLCDAPCSGTGCLGRNPEIRRHLTGSGLRRQHKRQVNILRSALQALAPGGRLIYSTCSLEAEENEEVLAAALAERTECALLPWRPRLQRLEAAGILHAGSAERLFPSGSRSEYLRILPGQYGCDGYFAALLFRRRSGDGSTGAAPVVGGCSGSLETGLRPPSMS